MAMLRRKRAAALILSLLLLIGSFADVLNLIDFNVFSAGEHNYIAIRCICSIYGKGKFLPVLSVIDKWHI